MCGKCEPMMSKAATLLGVVALLGAVTFRLTHMGIMGFGSQTLASASQLFFLLAIAINTCHHGEHV